MITLGATRERTTAPVEQRWEVVTSVKTNTGYTYTTDHYEEALHGTGWPCTPIYLVTNSLVWWHVPAILPTGRYSRTALEIYL